MSTEPPSETNTIIVEQKPENPPKEEDQNFDNKGEDSSDSKQNSGEEENPSEENSEENSSSEEEEQKEFEEELEKPKDLVTQPILEIKENKNKIKNKSIFKKIFETILKLIKSILFNKITYTITMVIILAILLYTVWGLVDNSMFKEKVTNFSTATPYNIREIPHDTFEDYELVYSELVQRHGSRNPTESKIKKMDDVVELFNKYTFIDCVNTWDLKNEGELIWRGKYEMNELGKFYKKEFQKLFANHTLDQINVTSSFKKRTRDSGIEFLRGFYSDDKEKYNVLFNETTGEFIVDNKKIKIPNLKKDEDIYLYYHKNCNKYNEYMKTEEPTKESKEYSDELMKNITEKVLKRMKRRGEIKPSVLNDNKRYEEFAQKLYKLMSDIYRFAQYEYTVFNKTKGIIELFDEHDSFEMSFAKDLETYKTKGNYTTLAYYIAIPLFDSIMNNIKSHLPQNDSNKGYIEISNENKYIANFRFAHAETVTPLMTLLGLNLEEKPLSKNMTDAEKRKRNWDSSKMAPFSAQIMFVVVKDKNEKYYVKTYLNQEAVKLPACPNDIFCPVNDFLSYYEKYTKDFDYNKFCGNK